MGAGVSGAGSKPASLRVPLRRRDVRVAYPWSSTLPAPAPLPRLEAGRIRPVIDKVFPFEEASEALDYRARGRAKGKVVVKIV